MLVTVDPSKLQAYNLSVQEISNAIQDSTTQIAAGTIRNNTIDFPLNLDTSLNTITDFENVVVKNNQGNLVFIKDIAKVTLEGFNTSPMITRFNSKPAIIMEVSTTNDANEILTASYVKQFLEKIKPTLPTAASAAPLPTAVALLPVNASSVSCPTAVL